MKSNNLTAYINKCLAILPTQLLFWIAKRFLTPFFLALLLALLLSALSEPLIRPLCRSGMKRSRAALLVVPLLLITLLFVLGLTGVVLGSQLETLLSDGSKAADDLSALLSRLESRLQDTKLGKLSVWQHLQALLEKPDPGPFFSGIRRIATAVPGLLLGLTFVLLGGYQLAAHRTEIFPFLGRQLPPRHAALVLQLKDFLLHTVFSWLKAQCILFAVTFDMLSLGLWLLKIPGWMLIALITSLLDALPVIGAGMILLPWALLSAVLGNTTLALELGAIYGIMEVIRNLLEPRILSAQLGLPPFVTLCCLYAGFTLMGVGGMLLFPLAALSVIKLQEWGYLTLWK